MSTKEAVDIELAKESLDNAKNKLYEVAAGIPGLRPDIIIADAERQTVMDTLIRAGICTPDGYMEEMAGNIRETMEELAGAGLVEAVAIEENDLQEAS